MRPNPLFNKRVVVCYSGGLDSTVLIQLCHRQSLEVAAISFDYGQSHRIELRYAANYAQKLGVRHELVDISTCQTLVSHSSLTSPNVELSVIVPNRNMIFLSLAAAWAINLEFDMVAFGAHAGDSQLFPDCRAEFVSQINRCLEVGNERRVQVCAPFLSFNKRDIVDLGQRLGVDFTATYSCYTGQEKSCGHCLACLERLEALKNG